MPNGLQATALPLSPVVQPPKPGRNLPVGAMSPAPGGRCQAVPRSPCSRRRRRPAGWRPDRVAGAPGLARHGTVRPSVPPRPGRRGRYRASTCRSWRGETRLVHGRRRRTGPARRPWPPPSPGRGPAGSGTGPVRRTCHPFHPLARHRLAKADRAGVREQVRQAVGVRIGVATAPPFRAGRRSGPVRWNGPAAGGDDTAVPRTRYQPGTAAWHLTAIAVAPGFPVARCAMAQGSGRRPRCRQAQPHPCRGALRQSLHPGPLPDRAMAGRGADTAGCGRPDPRAPGPFAGGSGTPPGPAPDRALCRRAGMR